MQRPSPVYTLSGSWIPSARLFLVLCRRIPSSRSLWRKFPCIAPCRASTSVADGKIPAMIVTVLVVAEIFVFCELCRQPSFLSLAHAHRGDRHLRGHVVARLQPGQSVTGGADHDRWALLSTTHIVLPENVAALSPEEGEAPRKFAFSELRRRSAFKILSPSVSTGGHGVHSCLPSLPGCYPRYRRYLLLEFAR